MMPSVGLEDAMRRACGVLCVLLAVVAAATASAQPTASEFNAAGVEQYNAKQYVSAIASFKKAYDLAPDNATVKRNLSNAYQAQANESAKNNDLDAAIETLGLAIGVDPGNALPLTQLGFYCLRKDLVADAAFRLEEAVELDPQSIDARELLGEAYFRQNDLASALAQWEWVLEVQPNRPGLRQKFENALRQEAVEGNFGKSGSRHFQVSYAPGTRGGDLSRLLMILERARWEIGRKFGGAYPPAPIQVIVYTADQFAQANQVDEHVGALYDGKIRVPLKDKAGAVISPNELQRRLYHEYTHAIVRFVAKDNVPWWLNEGLAETFSNDLSSADVAVLQEANRRGQLHPLHRLEEGQLGKLDASALGLAYLQAHACVNYLWNKFGQLPLQRMMTELASGVAPEQALVENYRRNYRTLELEVAANTGRSGSGS